ncbi:Imm1 family immunity protein [Streptomyces cinereoruber]|uniref:Imm1 family immunity protein n=1 Tax=Streptomyces cinereoruber TaxID=67260 RepID=UPI003C2E06E7
MTEIARAQAAYRRDHNCNPEFISTSGDVDVMIDALLAGPKYHNLAMVHSMERSKMPSGFFDHELMVGVNSDLQVGAITFMDETGNHVTVGEPGSREDPVYHLMGHRREFPAECEISIALVREAVKEFISSGGQRPRCVAWKPMEW